MHYIDNRECTAKIVNFLRIILFRVYDSIEEYMLNTCEYWLSMHTCHYSSRLYYNGKYPIFYARLNISCRIELSDSMQISNFYSLLLTNNDNLRLFTQLAKENRRIVSWKIYIKYIKYLSTYIKQKCVLLICLCSEIEFK